MSGTSTNIYQPDQDALTSVAESQASQGLDRNNDTISKPGLLDVVSSNFNQAVDRNPTSPNESLFGQSTLDTEAQNQLKILKNNGLLNDVMQRERDQGITGPVSAWNPFSAGNNYLTFAQKNPDLISDLQKKYPDLGIKSYDQINQSVESDYNQRVNALNAATQNNSGIMGHVAAFLGQTAGFLSTPAGGEISEIPLGSAVTGAGILRTMLTTGGEMAALSAGERALDQPGEIAYRRSIGENVTDDQARQEALESTLYGGALGAVLGGAGALLGRAFARTSSTTAEELSSKMEQAKQAEQSYATKTVKTAEDVNTQVNELLNNIPAGVSKEQHESALNKIFDDISTGNEPDTRSIVGESAKTPDISSGLNLDPVDLQKIDTSYKALQDQLGEAHVPLDFINDAGQHETRDSADVIRQVRSDEKTFKILGSCLNSGSVPEGGE